MHIAQTGKNIAFITIDNLQLLQYNSDWKKKNMPWKYKNKLKLQEQGKTMGPVQYVCKVRGYYKPR